MELAAGISTMAERLGVSGQIALRFQNSEITPLLALVGLLLGLFAITITPREKEPQINVTPGSARALSRRLRSSTTATPRSSRSRQDRR